MNKTYYGVEFNWFPNSASSENKRSFVAGTIAGGLFYLMYRDTKWNMAFEKEVKSEEEYVKTLPNSINPKIFKFNSKNEMNDWLQYKE